MIPWWVFYLGGLGLALGLVPVIRNSIPTGTSWVDIKVGPLGLSVLAAAVLTQLISDLYSEEMGWVTIGGIATAVLLVTVAGVIYQRRVKSPKSKA